jgi:hypothetical protein
LLRRDVRPERGENADLHVGRLGDAVGAHVIGGDHAPVFVCCGDLAELDRLGAVHRIGAREHQARVAIGRGDVVGFAVAVFVGRHVFGRATGAAGTAASAGPARAAAAVTTASRRADHLDGAGVHVGVAIVAVAVGDGEAVFVLVLVGLRVAAGLRGTATGRVEAARAAAGHGLAAFAAATRAFATSIGAADRRRATDGIVAARAAGDDEARREQRYERKTGAETVS